MYKFDLKSINTQHYDIEAIQIIQNSTEQKFVMIYSFPPHPKDSKQQFSCFKKKTVSESS